MKELAYADRGYIANQLRRRAIELQNRIEQTKSDKQRVELAEEAAYAEALAIRFDDGEDLVLEIKTPITATPNRDTRYLEENVSIGKGADPNTEAEHHTRRPAAVPQPRRVVGSGVKSSADAGEGGATAARQ